MKTPVYLLIFINIILSLILLIPEEISNSVLLSVYVIQFIADLAIAIYIFSAGTKKQAFTTYEIVVAAILFSLINGLALLAIKVLALLFYREFSQYSVMVFLNDLGRILSNGFFYVIVGLICYLFARKTKTLPKTN